MIKGIHDLQIKLRGKVMCKVVTLLGSSGSIGVQSLKVIKRLDYKVFGLSVFSNIDILLKQIIDVQPQYVCVVDETACEKLETQLKGQPNAPKILKGTKGLIELTSLQGADIVINAIVGIAGLASTLSVIENGIDLALANKESLVAGGELVMQKVKEKKINLIPVDSEHSAIFQCLQDTNSKREIDRILLTASGGPFFGFTKEQLSKVTKQDALKHPNWNMGSKITIDSASLMNKGLELIEAVWLFNVPCENVEIVVQRQSIIHSMVEFSDNSILAQLGVPDMSIPIQYSLTWPDRYKSIAPKLDFKTLSKITFDQADEENFRCLPACKQAIIKGGLAPCAVNGANEMAVELFLNDKIKFLQIGELVEMVSNEVKPCTGYTVQDVYDCDKWAREFVLAKI